MSNSHSMTSSKEFIVLMAVLMSIVAISIDAMLPALGIMGADLGVSHPNHVQYVVSFIFLGMTIGELACGPLSDAIGRKKVLYIGIGAYLLGSLICFFAQDFSLLLLGRLIQGLGVAGPYVCTMSIVRDKYSGREMARVMSVIMMIFIMVPAIAPTLGQGILMLGSWRYIFVLYIAYSIIVGLWLWLRLEETLAPENRIPFRFKTITHGIGEVVKNRTTFGYTICVGMIFGSLIGYLNCCPQIFQGQFGVGKMFTVYFGCLALVFGLSSLVNSRLVEKLGMRHICYRAALCFVAGSIVFLGVQLITTPTLWMFMAYVALLFFCFGLMFGNLNAIAMEPMGHIAGIASALIGAISSAVAIPLGAFIGQLYNNTLIPITLGFVVLGLMALAAMFWADRGRQPSAEPTGGIAHH